MKPASVASPSVAQAIPLHTDGMRIGLLGGSFNPPHVAHRAISLFAIKRLKLDRVWWLVSPGNPLKEHGALRDLDNAPRPRAGWPTIRASTSAVSNPSSERATLSTRSIICAAALPACAWSGSWALTISRNFIAGKTGGASPSEVPIAVIDRPPQSFRALAAPAAQALARYRAARKPGRPARRPARAGLGVPHRHEDQSVVDRTAEPGRKLEDKVTAGVHWNIETINPTCVV